MRLTGYVKPYKALCSTVIGWFSTALIGAFWSSLFWWVVLSAACFFTALLLLCFLIVASMLLEFQFHHPVDVVRAKSYVNHLFDPSCVPMQITRPPRFYLTSKVCPSNCFQVWNYAKITPCMAKTPCDPIKQDCAVYRIPCDCGKVYISESGRPMKDRIKEHEWDIRFAHTQTSTVLEQHQQG